MRVGSIEVVAVGTGAKAASSVAATTGAKLTLGLGLLMSCLLWGSRPAVAQLQSQFQSQFQSQQQLHKQSLQPAQDEREAAAAEEEVASTPPAPDPPEDNDPFDYEASEEISEDLSVSFPVDI